MFSWDFESFYNAFSDFFVKWFARGHITGTGQKSRQGSADTSRARRDAPDARFS